MLQTPQSPDYTHVSAATVALRNTYPNSLRKWGLRITVTDDPTPANNGDYILLKGYVDSVITNNNNWQKQVVNGAGGSLQQFQNIVYNIGGDSSYSLLTPYAGHFSTVGAGFGAEVIEPGDIPNNSALIVIAKISGIKADGAEGYSGTVTASFRKNNAGVLSILGASVSALNEDIAIGGVTAALSANGNGGVQIDVGMPGAVGHFTQSVWLDIAMTTV